MHLLKYVSIVLAVLAVVMLIVAQGYGDAGRSRKGWYAAAAICVLATTTIVVGLARAQRPICTTLGGQWIAETHACRDEFGGNGNNDPGNGMSFSD